MKRLLSIMALLGLTGLGLNLSAQQTPSTSQQQETNATDSQQTARSFEGRIMKAGGKLVLQEASTHTAYLLDDQDKAKEFQGKEVKIMATLDQNTNMLHIVDIIPAESR